MSEVDSIVLAVGGERCRIVCENNPAIARALARDLAAFVSDGEPTLTVSVEMDSGMQDPPSAGWKGMRMDRRAEGLVAEGPSHRIRIPFEMDRVEARIVRYFQLATVMRIGLCTLLPMRGRGFLVHAAAVASGRGAYLFPGQSDAGKSTLVANSPGKRRLTEETAVVRRENGAYQVFGFPIWARLDALSMAPEPTPLVGMFLLKKGPPRINPVTRPAALAYLIQNVYSPFQDFETRTRVLDTCSRFVEAVPSAELVFSKNPDFWRCIERD